MQNQTIRKLPFRDGCDSLPILPDDLWIMVIFFTGYKNWIVTLRNLLLTHYQFHPFIHRYLSRFDSFLESYFKHLDRESTICFQVKLNYSDTMNRRLLEYRDEIQSKMDSQLMKDLGLLEILNRYNLKEMPLNVYKNAQMVHCIFNPFYGLDLEQMNIETGFIDLRMDLNSTLYMKNAFPCIRWDMLAIKTNLNNFFDKMVKPIWIDTHQYVKDLSTFCAHVAEMMIEYPHVDINGHDDYIRAFLSWIENIPDMPLLTIASLLNKSVKRILYLKNKACVEWYEMDKEIAERYILTPTMIECIELSRHALGKQINRIVKMKQSLKIKHL